MFVPLCCSEVGAVDVAFGPSVAPFQSPTIAADITALRVEPRSERLDTAVDRVRWSQSIGDIAQSVIVQREQLVDAL